MDNATVPSTTPMHLRPHSCFVCGRGPHVDNASHNYWSNTAAVAWFKAQINRDADAAIVNGASLRAEAGEAL